MLADYYIIILILKHFLSSYGNIKLVAASAYFTIYFSLLINSINFALIDTHGLLGSHDIANNLNRLACLRLKQTILLGTIMFFFFSIIPNFYYPTFLINFLNVDPEIAHSAQVMIFWSLPAMFLRTLNDSFKTFLQNQGVTTEIGYYYLILVGIFLPLIYFLIEIIELKVKLVGITLFLFEGTGLVISLIYFKGLKRSLDFSVPIRTKLKDYTSLFLKHYIIDFPGILQFELENFIVTLRDSVEEIAVFTIFSSSIYVIIFMASGFTFEVRKRMNRALSYNNPFDCVSYLRMFKSIFFFSGLFFAGIWLLISWCLENMGGYDNEEKLKFYFKSGKYYLFFRAFFLFFIGYQLASLRVVGVKDKISWFYSIPEALNNFGSYFLGIYLGYGVIGIFFYETLFDFCCLLVLRGVISEEFFFDYAKIAVEHFGFQPWAGDSRRVRRF